MNRRVLALIAGFACLSSWAQAKPNVLFIAVDDLRPVLGCYGDPIAITPNIDRIAAKGTVFERAYCQEAVCSPSRISLMTGRRPDTTQVWDLKTHFREALPEVVTLPQHFKNEGYYTRSIGKIYHGSGKPAKDPPSWSEEPLHDVTRDPELRYALPENLAGEGLKRAASEAANVPDSTYVDGVVCEDALKVLGDLAGNEQPFFLAVGFRKPHLPFCAPQKYWDFYDRDQIPVPVSSSHPQDAPEYAVRSWDELQGYTDIEDESNLSQEKVQELRHGYYACVSYIDALVGRLLDRLGALELANETVICLWGDHGFHLGEQGLWTKANNYELSTRVPLIFASPNQKAGGTTCSALVELVDLYPTLADVCGLPAPTGIEGVSFAPLLDNPELSWKSAAFSQYPRAKKGNRHEGHGDIMGYAIRTERHRYVEWREWESGNVLARELYDEERDPEEMINQAANPEYASVLADLEGQLTAGWWKAVPK